MNAVTLATFNEPQQAEAVKNRLESSGVHAVVQDLRKWQRLLSVKNSMAGLVVEVDRRDFENAKHLVEDWDRQEGMLKDAVHCPQCGSPRIEFPQYTRKFFTPAFHVGIGIALGILPKEFYCQDCQYTWPTEEKLDVKRDVMGWPSKP